MPRVTIGLPVYNGENYLEEAIRSVLVQSFDDLELIICDNASTDRTAEICRDAAARDPRVRYFQNECNLGAARNYNRTWEHGTGEFFKWFAHDDRIKPTYIEKTLAALEADPAAVLCNTVAEYIGSAGEHLGYYRSVLQFCQSDKPAERLAAIILRSHTCIDFFGLIRRSAMVGSILHQAFSAADKAFIAQMALRGRLLQLDEPLVEMREHPHRYTRATKTARMKLAWHDTSKAHTLDVPTLTLFRVYRELVASAALSDADRRECRAVLRRFWLNHLNLARLAADLASIPFPSAVSRAFNLRYRLFGAPGNFLR
jgi:glycosyltransferase involved in cell wall biosynthesis